MDRNDSKSHDQSLSLDHVSVVPLIQARAKASIDIELTILYLNTCRYCYLLYRGNKKEPNFVKRIVYE